MIYAPGKKVVCIDDDFSGLSEKSMRAFRQLPVKNAVYTIREFEDPSVKLEEIKNPKVKINMGGVLVDGEAGFHKNRFAPLLDNRDQMTDSLLEEISEGIEEELLEYFDLES